MNDGTIETSIKENCLAEASETCQFCKMSYVSKRTSKRYCWFIDVATDNAASCKLFSLNKESTREV